jgi:dienelactone hydrolase
MYMATPMYLKPFVLPVASVDADRQGPLDIYWPDSEITDAVPAIIFVPGGPLPPDLEPRPRDWPVFRGYGSLAAAHGVAGITVEHRLDSPSAYATAAQDIVAATDAVRRLPGVDSGRVALWFFSGAGMLAADWIRETPSWLRALAASYPVMAPWPGMDVDPRFRPTDALADVEGLPILITRVGQEQPVIGATVDAFIDEARQRGALLDVINVPDGHHSFDIVDDTDVSRAALTQSMKWVAAQLLA